MNKITLSDDISTFNLIYDTSINLTHGLRTTLVDLLTSPYPMLSYASDRSGQINVTTLFHDDEKTTNENNTYRQNFIDFLTNGKIKTYIDHHNNIYTVSLFGNIQENFIRGVVSAYRLNFDLIILGRPD